MAEQVQHNIEEMIPELELLERIGFFITTETKQILKKRKAFEYKLCRRTRIKQDYLDYIQYEINVLDLVKKRRRDTGYTFKRKEIDIIIIKRIHKLFTISESRFHNDIKLWISHIEFSKRQHEKALVGRLYTKMLQMHSNNAGLWILAAKWELESNKSIDNSRKLLQRGLRFNDTSKKLWIEYFRMELLNCEIMKQRNIVLGLSEQMNSEDNVVLNGKIAMIVAYKAVEQFPENAEFCHKLLKVALIFSMPKLHEQIYELFLKNYKKCEVTWKVLAERKILEVNQRIEDTKQQKNQKTKKFIERDTNDKDLADAKKHCLQVYSDALKLMPTTKMYNFYLSTIFEHFDTSLLDVEVVFQEALTADALSEQFTLKWIELSAGEMKKLLTLNVFQRFPFSPEVLKEYLHCQIKVQRSKDLCIKAVKRFFDFPRDSNNEKVEQKLWNVVFDFSCEYLKSFIPELMDMVMSSSSTQIIKSAKTSYLKYIYDTKDIKEVRKTYRKFHERPASVDFFRLYIAIELSQEDIKHSLIAKCYENSLSIYGECQPDVWLNYIKHELGSATTANNVDIIFWKAKKKKVPTATLR